MKNRKRECKTEQNFQGHRFIWSMILLAVILIVLIAAFWIIRPLLLASISTASQTTAPDLTGNTSSTASILPAETSGLTGERPEGSISALPAAAFRRGRTVTIGVGDPFGQINPLYGGGDADQDAIALIFEPLLRLDPAGEPELILAADIKPDPAAGTLTVKLQPDHTWRDGRAVNARDVAFTYNCLLSPSYDGPLAGRFNDISEVKTLESDKDVSTVVIVFQPEVTDFDYKLLTIGILKYDYYNVDINSVYEMGRRKLAPEGSGAYELLNVGDDRRLLGLRAGYAGEIEQIEQIQVGSDEKYPLLEAGSLDIVRHDWDERIKSRVARLPAYAYYESARVDQYLLITPDPGNNGLPADQDHLAALLAIASGQNQNTISINSTEKIKLAYFAGIEDTISHKQTANAGLIKQRLESARQPTLD